MLQITVVTKLDMDHMLLSLRSRALFHLVPLIGHLIQSQLSDFILMLLHELESSKEMSVGEYFSGGLELFNMRMVSLKLLEQRAVRVMHKVEPV